MVRSGSKLKRGDLVIYNCPGSQHHMVSGYFKPNGNTGYIFEDPEFQVRLCSGAREYFEESTSHNTVKSRPILKKASANDQESLLEEDSPGTDNKRVEQHNSLTRTRNIKSTFLNGRYPEHVVEQVFERGRLANREKDSAHCYLCDRFLEKQKRKCTCPRRRDCNCGAWELEHVIAKSRDPIKYDVISNLLPACVACNCQAYKGKRTLLECVNKSMQVMSWAGEAQGLMPCTQEAIQAAIKKKHDVILEQLEEPQKILASVPKFPRNELEGDWKPIGTGAQASVYKAKWKQIKVAIKVLQPDNPTQIKNTLREIDYLNQVRLAGGHPHILHPYGFFQEEKKYCLVVQYHPRTLQSCIDNKNCKVERLRIMEDVANALEFLHQRDIIHRDVKPGNILVTTEGRGVLGDFGHSRLVGPDMTAGGVGSAYYRDPVIGPGCHHYTSSTDMYSFGKTASKVKESANDQQEAEVLETLHKNCIDKTKRWTAKQARDYISAISACTSSSSSSSSTLTLTSSSVIPSKSGRTANRQRVYVTDSGGKFHAKLNCSSATIAVDKSELSSKYTACRKCIV
eukprot:TRINITY_DN3900_c0_g1_i1.p1 TRINITY_DN3900_c0_g1~~TRINITY_DN3900_c0_g1_i1.p1  ORF type:complete len:569 (-),score=91.29 TRINITY_DN3900_c0_g1_i1:167-1873(-)